MDFIKPLLMIASTSGLGELGTVLSDTTYTVFIP